MKNNRSTKRMAALWFARIAVLTVFAINVHCAFSFFLFPERYLGAYGLSGIPGKVALQGLAIAFLMWNATYPLVIINPEKYRILYVVVLFQQFIGLVGESVILLGIPDGYVTLSASILRFIVFDAGGLILMAVAFVVLSHSTKKALST